MSIAMTIRGGLDGRRRALHLLLLGAVGLALLTPVVAWGYTEGMGPTRLSPGSYLQTAGAHTFKQVLSTSTGSATAQACQIYNGSGVNIVDHGNGFCWVMWQGTAYVWGRAYNQGAWDDTFSAMAST